MHETHRRESLSPEPGEPWWAWLERRTEAMYETLVAHRDAPRVVAGNRPTVDALPAIESTLATLVDAGFQPAEAIEVILALGAFATGCALESQAESTREMESHTGELGLAIRAGDYPTIARAFTEFRAQHDPGELARPHDHMFAHGLRMVIAGLRASIDERSASRQAVVG
jgi:TetR/AcrR family tetracycline transcriptional repressor